jgi:hypothetical protein
LAVRKTGGGVSSEEEKAGSVSSVCFHLFLLIKMYAPDKEGAKSTLYHIFVQNLHGFLLLLEM